MKQGHRLLSDADRADVALARRACRAAEASHHRAHRRGHRVQHHGLALPGPAAHRGARRRPHRGGSSSPRSTCSSGRRSSRIVASRSVVALVILTLLFQAVAIWLLDPFIPSVTFTGGFIGAFVVSLVFGFLTGAISLLFGLGEDDSYYGTLVRTLASRRPDVIRTDEPGLVIIQVDGLSHDVMSHSLRAGRVPTMAQLDQERQPQAGPLGRAAALDDARQPGRHPARQQRRHPQLPLVGEGERAAPRRQPPGGRDGDRASHLATAKACSAPAARASATSSPAMATAPSS